MTTIGVVINTTRLEEYPEMVGEARAAVDALVHRADAVWVDTDAARVLQMSALGHPEEDLAARADLLVAFGGDGTILRTARLAAGRSVPVLGVNMGGFGFLAELNTEDLLDALPDLLAGRYELDERMMLQATVEREAAAQRLLALNDMVVTKSGVTRVLHLRVLVNGEPLASYPADGVIMATPTGSTAYSLSAGGPIVHPSVNAMVITPICPHTFNARSVVVDGGAVLTVELAAPVPEATLTVDGRVGVSLTQAERVVVRRAAQTTRFVRLRSSGFYAILRTKLAWGGR